MMSTPFDNASTNEQLNLSTCIFGAVLESLEDGLRQKPMPSVYICTPAGMGKTTLLNRFFTPEKTRELVEQGHLVEFCHFSDCEMETDADVINRQIEAVELCLQRISNVPAEYTQIKESFAALKAENPTYRSEVSVGKVLLEHMLSVLNAHSYYPVLILDDFHNLTCSGKCSTHTFDYMSGIAISRKISYICASDFHAKVASAAYGVSDFERIMSVKCFGDEIRTVLRNRNTKKKLKKKIDEILEVYQEKNSDPDETPTELSDSQFDLFWRLTGGIPELLLNSLKAYYTFCSQTDDLPDDVVLERIAYSACEQRMRYWTKHFKSEHWEALKTIYQQRDTSAVRLDPDIASSITQFGLVIADFSFNRYEFICPLFEKYIENVFMRRREELGELANDDQRIGVFLSYRHDADSEKVKEVHDFLAEKKYKPFYDNRLPEMRQGNYDPNIMTALNNFKNLVAIVSDTALLEKDLDVLRSDPKFRWQANEMYTFKSMINDGMSDRSLIILVTDEIFDKIRTNKCIPHAQWRIGVDILPYSSFRTNLPIYLPH